MVVSRDEYLSKVITDILKYRAKSLKAPNEKVATTDFFSIIYPTLEKGYRN